ncbi:hypothetical protein ISS07_06270 [Candidatus Woesearchaeota archaeon]|nr:hypothetical protein [Candidatus Woesearchaeota archaeon]
MRPKTIKNINKILVLSILLISIIYSASYYKPTLYIKDNYAWHVYMAKKHMSIVKNDVALEHVKKAISIEPERTDAYEIKTTIYRRIGLIDQLKQELSFLNDPNKTVFYYHNLGVIMFRENKLDESSIYLKQSIEKNPSYSPNYVYLGMLSLKTNNLDDAFFFLNKSINLIEQYPHSDPLLNKGYHTMIHVSLENYYLKIKKYDESRKEAQIAESIGMKPLIAHTKYLLS